MGPLKRNRILTGTPGTRDIFFYHDRGQIFSFGFGILLISPELLNQFGPNFDKIVGEVKYTYPSDSLMPNGSFLQRRPSGAISYSKPSGVCLKAPLQAIEWINWGHATTD